MPLSSDEIQFISRKIVKTLVSAERLEVDDEARVVDGIARVIANELSVEDRLNEEAREVLSSFRVRPGILLSDDERREAIVFEVWNRSLTLSPSDWQIDSVEQPA